MAKLWWVWAVVALGVAAMVILGTNEAPERLRATGEVSSTAETPVLLEPLADPAVVASTSSTPAEALNPLPPEGAEVLDTVPQVEVDVAQTEAVAEGPVEQNAVPLKAADTDAVAVADAAQDTSTRRPATGLAQDMTVEAAEPEIAVILDAPEVKQTTNSSSETILVPDVEVAEPTLEPAPLPEPDPILPALALADPSQSAAPETGNAPASGPAAETEPLFGAASPPLSLAQVLPPGEAPVPNQIAPSFDLVRVAPDGSALIAGRAEPGATVQVFSGTIPVAEATASTRGEFVVFLSAPSDTTLDLQIPAAPEGAALVVSQADIIILPAAPNAEDSTPIVVRRTPDAVQILQPAAPVVPGNVSLDLVSYADSGAVQLAGRGHSGNVARVYADGNLAGESPISHGGTWELEIPDIAEGRYVLRVDEVSPTGDVLSRTESPFQRQFPEAQMPDSFSQGAKIIVQPGNTLWLMATEAYGDGDAFLQIFTANKDTIRDPNLIYPGQIFAIPRIEE